jgi:hypothetical protein
LSCASQSHARKSLRRKRATKSKTRAGHRPGSYVGSPGEAGPGSRLRPEPLGVSALRVTIPRANLHPLPGAVGPASRRWRRYADAPAAALLTGRGAGEWREPYAHLSLFETRERAVSAGAATNLNFLPTV